MTGTLPSPEVLRAIAADAARAPSVHNVQPARWVVRASDGLLALVRDPSRTLPVADPAGRDDRASLGAALEGFSLAASLHVLRIEDLEWDERAHAVFGARAVDGLPVAATFRLVAGGVADPLARYVGLRRTWRGRFVPSSAAASALAQLAVDPEAADARMLDDSARSHIADAVDEATWAFERQPAYHRELWDWMRLDRGDPRYSRDGLTADALALSGAERIAARVVLQPRVFRVFQSTGLGRVLVSERAATSSAAGFVCHVPAPGHSSYAVGRRLYRLWLAATRVGLALAPMSAIVDHDRTRRRVAHLLALPDDRRLSQVFRAGCAPGEIPSSPRLPLDEILLVR